MKKRVIWRVGSGTSIDTWSVNWTPRASPQRPLATRPGVEVQKVAELLLPDGQGWNVQKLNECFFEGYVVDVLETPVGRAGLDDYVAWNYTKNGCFSVRSAYHSKRQITREREGQVGSSVSCIDHGGWNALWSVNVLNKVKVHCWRMAVNGIAIGDELRRRRIKEGVHCIVCKHAETMIHQFWTCPHSVEVWSSLRTRSGMHLSWPRAETGVHRDFQNWLLGWASTLKPHELTLAMMALYHMWLARNNARDEPMIEHPEETTRRVLALYEEWLSLAKPSRTQHASTAEHWLPPDTG